MSDLTIDATVANRFISSLSKSLQALCHGCMEFSSGIEIVGYININVDQGNKVDYVLNEKVLKSTTNSMTFVSNSFLAKKEQPKHTRDGACSPVFEFQEQQQSHHNSSNQHASFQYRRSSYAHSSQSHQFRSSQKRAWSGVEKDWRSSKKHSRRDRVSFQQSHYLPPLNNSPIDTSLIQTPGTTDSFLQPELPVLNYINIKKELTESDSSAKQKESEYSPSESSSISKNDTTEDKVSIKADPDILSETERATKTDNVQPSSNSNIGPFFDKILESHNLDADGPGQCSSHIDTGDSKAANQDYPDESNASDNLNEQIEVSTNSEMPRIEFDEAQDSISSISYPQSSSFTDQEEGFDIIEIDDEDEAAIYVDAGTQLDGGYSAHGYEPQTSIMAYINPDRFIGQDAPYNCDFCEAKLPSLNRYRKHIATHHSNAFPYSCTICGKGFLNKGRLKIHIQDHGARQFQCPLCHLRFKRNYHMKRHLKNQHDQITCSGCMQTFKPGPEYSNHVSQCDAIQRQLEMNTITQSQLDNMKRLGSNIA